MPADECPQATAGCIPVRYEVRISVLQAETVPPGLKWKWFIDSEAMTAKGSLNGLTDYKRSICYIFLRGLAASEREHDIPFLSMLVRTVDHETFHAFSPTGVRDEGEERAARAFMRAGEWARNEQEGG
jgi:hypothetical protein